MALTDNIDEKIKQARSLGYSDAQIKTYLASQGITPPRSLTTPAQPFNSPLTRIAQGRGAENAEVAKGAIKQATRDITSAGLQKAGPVGSKIVQDARKKGNAFVGALDSFDAATEPNSDLQREGARNTIIAEAALPGPKAAATVAKTAQKAATATARTAGKGLEATGQKIQQSVIRPAIADIKDGFKIENIAKYDVGGSLPETVAKTHAKLNELGQQLSAKLKGSDVKINLSDTLAETARRLSEGKAGSFGDNAALDRVLDQIGDEVQRLGGNDLDLVTATNVKRGAGSKGAWAYNRPEADASAIERAYTEFYSVLKEQIERAAPEGVKEINRQLSDLISIQNAALRRLPIEQRNNVFSLTDSIGFLASAFDPKALLLVGASKAAKSGKVGNALVKTGQRLQGRR